MNATHREQYLDLSGELEAALIAGARDLAPVRGLTHDFYKYPARFSPAFARTLIEVFSHLTSGCRLLEAQGEDSLSVQSSEICGRFSTVGRPTCGLRLPR